MLRFVRTAIMAALVAGALGGQTGQKPQKGEAIGQLVFRLELNELHPERVTVGEGWWAIRLLNGVIRTDLSLELDQDSGVRVAAKTAKAHKARTSMLVYLKQGKHVLKIPGNAKWRSEIEVGPPKR